jgi:hypothetical protein
MRNTVSALLIAGTVCTVALFAFLETSPKSGLIFLQDPREIEFNNFITKQRRSYGTKAEYELRRDLFIQRFEEIESHNAENSSFRLKINKFADFTPEEYRRLLGYRSSSEPREYDTTLKLEPLRGPIDWRTEGKVSPVKD